MLLGACKAWALGKGPRHAHLIQFNGWPLNTSAVRTYVSAFPALATLACRFVEWAGLSQDFWGCCWPIPTEPRCCRHLLLFLVGGSPPPLPPWPPFGPPFPPTRIGNEGRPRSRAGFQVKGRPRCHSSQNPGWDEIWLGRRNHDRQAGKTASENFFEALRNGN